VPTDPTLTRGEQEVLGAFRGAIEPVPVPLLYRLGLVVVAIAMVFLPLVYVGLVLLSGYGVYYHAVYNLTLFDDPGGKGGFFLYVAPLVAGGILVLFMVKPLFAPRGERRRPVQVQREQEPLLFAFVERLCDTVGAPRPREIHVDCEVNASASLRRGLRSLFSSDLVLTIGLPLAAGLDLRQLAGVLAHEFGHFAQQAGMRLTYVIRMVSYWFARVVYERDAWDQRLVAWSEGVDVRIGVVFYLARFFVWLTRKILWVLMVVGSAISSFLLRQMEFDADRYEARLAGSEAFERTARALPVLAVAAQGAQSDLGDFWAESRLADDLPALVVANRVQIPHEVRGQIEAELEARRTGVFDTHPADHQRIASARREDAPGVFQHEGPARLLFRDFEALCRLATTDYYEGLLGDEVRPEQLRPVSELLAQQEQRTEGIKSLRRYLQGVVTALRPLALPAVDAEGDIGATLAQLREQLGALAPAYREAVGRLEQLDQRLSALAQAEALLWAGFDISGLFEGLDLRAAEEVEALREQVRAEQRELEGALEPAERVAAERLALALERADTDELRTLLPVHRQLVQLVAAGQELPFRAQATEVLVRQLEGPGRTERLIETLKHRLVDLRLEIHRLHEAIDPALPYPFAHGEEGVTLQRHLVPRVPEQEELGPLLEAAQIAGNLFPLYVHVLARLASIAERVERELGLEPLPDLEEDPGEG